MGFSEFLHLLASLEGKVRCWKMGYFVDLAFIYIPLYTDFGIVNRRVFLWVQTIKLERFVTDCVCILPFLKNLVNFRRRSFKMLY
jgi:hypothetical protein